MNKLFKNKFLRENLVLLIILGLIFPQYAFSDAWVADTGNDQVSRLYRDGHAPTLIKVTDVGEDGDTVAVNINPTGLFYPGLKLSFGMNRADVYEIDSVDSDIVNGWVIKFINPFPILIDNVTTDSQIYMELVRSGGFESPVSVSTNTYNTKVWFADDSTNDSGITQFTGWGRGEPSDTSLVKPYDGGTEFAIGDTMFDLYSQDASIYPGIKIDFYSDNRAGGYVLETKKVDKVPDPYILTTYSGLPSDHSIIDKKASVIHIDRFRDETLISPKSVCANSVSNRNNSEYDTAWAAEDTATDTDYVIKYTQDWKYRMPIALSSSTPEDDFQIKVELNTIEFDYSNVYGANGDDIRFTDSGGKNLRYWIEEWNSSDTSTIWVKVKNSGTDKIYMYYGNSAVTFVSDGENTFIFFDDFTGTDGDLPDIAKWTVADAPVVINNNKLRIGAVENPGTVVSADTVLQPCAVDYKYTPISDGGTFSDFAHYLYKLNDNDVRNIFNHKHSVAALRDKIRIYSNVEGDLIPIEVNPALSHGTEYSISIKIDSVAGHIKINVDGEQEVDYDYDAFGKTLSTRVVSMGTYKQIDDVDDYRIRKYATTEPSAVLGDEQAVRYAGLLKVGGFNNPKSISVNSSNGEVWIADTDNSEVVKLYKGGHKTISGTVFGDYPIGEYKIALTDISEIDSGINISFNGYTDDAYRISMDIPEDWWDSRWAFRKPLILDKNDILGDEILEDFPVMVKLTPERFDYSKSAPLGADIRFTDMQGEQLPHEIEKWDEDDTSIIWVKAPLIPKEDISVDTDIWLYYGYPQASDDQRPKDVWNDSYVMVQHLQEDPLDTAPQMLDSTINSNDGTTFGTITQAQGQINGALEFAEIDDYVKVSDSNSLDIADTITISAWLNDVSLCPWFEDWLYREKITIDHTKIDSDLTNFPVAVILDNSNFDFSRARSDGFDIRFTDSDGQDTLLYERERHDSALGLAEYWVKIPNISSDADTVLYMYWGKSDAADGADTQNVWDSNYVMVQHMKDGSSDTNILDSTSNSNDGTKKGAGEPIEIDGKIGKGQDFVWDAFLSGDYIQTATPVISGNITTYGGWIRWDAIAPDGSGCDVPLQQADAVDIGFEIYADSGDNSVYAWDGTSFPGGYGISIGTWYQVYVVHTGTQFALYVNGARVGAWINSVVTAPSENFVIGGGLLQNTWWFDGTIDEVRISDIARSAEWIKASYYSQNDELLSYEETEFFGTQINKDGAYGIGRIKDTPDTVIGIINNNIVSASIGSGWQQVVLVYDGATQKLYVGGDLVADTDLSEPINTNINDFIIGGSGFNGPIDEIRISDTALSDSWIKASFASESDDFINYGEPEESIGVTLYPVLRSCVLNGSSVARELARISGFTEPVAVVVDSVLGNCWVADGSDTVVWINGDIGEADITTAGYNINTDAGYHKIITGFDNPVSVATDPLSGNCWVACDGGIGTDSYIVRLDKDVGDGYALNGNRHIKIYGFDSPNAVSIDPSTGDCYVADGTDGGQIVRLAPEGHKWTGYKVDGSYSEGATIINLFLDTIADSQDTLLYRPLKVSFGNFTTDIKPVYKIESVEYDNVNDTAVITILPGLEQDISSGIKLNKELARVGGFDSPTALSAFKGEDLGLGLHPWRLQVREFYDVDGIKYPSEGDDGWRDFPANIPIHDATPQFRWRYIDIDGDYLQLQSYRIKIWTRQADGDFVSDPVWDSDELTVDLGREIYPGQWIYTDWDNDANTKENDSTGIYSTDYGNSDEDDCPDLSQIEDSDTDLGDRTYFVQLTVKNSDGAEDTYPLGSTPSSDTSIIVFTLDKTPPGSYRVCGTEVFVPATEEHNIKTNWGDSIDAPYLQTDNYYWDEVWVQWDGGDTEIVDTSSIWIPKKQVTVRVKVKDRNNENPFGDSELAHEGHDNTDPLDEFNERKTDCSGISLNAQYRFRSTLMATDEWSEWKDCDEVRLYDEDALMSNNQGQRLLQGGVKDDFVWLYAKNVLFADGDTNLIQFRVLDEGYMEVSKIAKDKDSFDTAEVWIAPNMGYSHADTIIEHISRDITYQTSSSEFGYKLKIDSNVPQVILVNYPSNPYPHSFASFKWVAIDTTPCRFKWRLEWLDNNGNWVADSDGDASNGEDPFTYLENTCNWQDGEAWLGGGAVPAQKGTLGTSVSFEGLQVGGLYRFWVKAKDLDGAACDPIIVSRRVSTPAVWVWYVSPEVPNTIITSGPSGQTTNNSPTFRWRGVGGMPPYTYNWKLRGSGGGSGSGTDTDKNFGTLGVGNYIFEVRASDNNGSDPTPAKRIFTVVDPDHPPYSTVSPKNLYKYFREIGE